MMQANHFLPKARLAALGAVTVLSVIILAMAAHILSTTQGFYSPFLHFAALAIATAGLSLLTLPAMICIDKVRTGALPSFIVAEVGWLGFLWVMWLATGSLTASINLTGGSCSFGNSEANTFCSEINVIEAFAFLNWLILLTYYIALLAFSFQAYQRGNTRVWFSSVKDTDFDAVNHNQEKPYDPNAFVAQYPPSTPGMVVTPLQPQANLGVAQV